MKVVVRGFLSLLCQWVVHGASADAVEATELPLMTKQLPSSFDFFYLLRG